MTRALAALLMLPLLGAGQSKVTDDMSACHMLVALPFFAAAQSGIDLAGIRRATFATLEKRFDKRLLSAPKDDPFDLLVGTRALYLEGFGVVFTAELSLAVTPTINPFRQEMSPADKQRVWVRKVKALPVLRQTMREMLVASADALPMIPERDQVVLAVRLLYLPWEKTDTLPGQIIMRGERSALMRAGAAANGAIRTEEF